MSYYSDVAVKVGSSVQQLVQSVTVNSDAGLDFSTVPKSTSQNSKPRAVISTIEIEYLGASEITKASITGDALANAFGDITIHTYATDANHEDVVYKNCLLAGQSNSITAGAGSYGKSTTSYICFGGHIAVTGNTWITTQSSITETGYSRTSTSMCWDTGNYGSDSWFSGDFLSYENSCTINREPLYNQTSFSPSAITIKYPIETTSKITRINATDSKHPDTETFLCRHQYASSIIDGIVSGSYDGMTVQSPSAGSNEPHTTTFNFKSQTDYGLTRNIPYTGVS